MSDSTPQFMHECKDSNDIVYMVSKRAGELADMKMDDLRLLVTSDPYGRIGSARAEFSGATKGQLIDEILTEEFAEEFGRDLESDE